MQNSRSLANRAVLALLLMAGFYVLAIGISGVLLWIPYAEVVYLGRVHPKLALGCIVAAAAVLWAIVPRPDKFEPPGPRLTRAGAPVLFALIDDIARTTKQTPPVEVYLLNDVNAFVTQRGGVMGFGSRRVMGVGLPLLAHLSPAELAAVIAHEFGHYVSGDVGLGPWIYKTRAAIGRSIAATDETWVGAPFRAYALLFLRTTLAVSREQEFVADRTAARVAGSAAAASALNRVAALSPAYTAYLNGEVTPLLQAGFLPPVAAGFSQYLQQPRVLALMETPPIAHDVSDGDGSFDTHPPMRDRIAALQRLPAAAPAIATAKGAPLGQMDQHAKVLMRHVLGEEQMTRLKPIAWDDVGDTVYARRWHDMATEYAGWLGSRTVGELPAGRQALVHAGTALIGKDEEGVSEEEGLWRAVHVFAAGVGAAMVRDGWQIETAPGQPLVLVKGEMRFEPGDAVARLANGKDTAEAWRTTCERLGIARLPIAGRPVSEVAAAG